MATSKITPVQKSQRIISMRVQLLALFTILFSLVFSLAAYWLLSYIDSVVLYQIRSDLTSTLQGAAANTDGNMLVALAKDGKPNADGYSDDPRYTQMMSWLEQIHDLEPRAWPFVYVPGQNQNQIFYVADLQSRYEPKRSAKFLEENSSAEIQWKGLRELTVRPGENSNGKFGTYSDEWGQWVTAYAPIKSSGGQLVGGMGIDFPASYVDEVRRSVLQKVEIAFVMIFLVMFLLIWRMTDSFTRPIMQLTNIADKIGAGDYEHQDSLSWIMDKRPVRDELSRMANTFSVMIEKVSTREHTLRQQVQELKIEIDEVKRKAQVAEIVETDFFRDLKTKADRLRIRMQDAGRDAPAAKPSGGDSSDS
jgi:methyl-accepting chemotaxis protein